MINMMFFTASNCAVSSQLGLRKAPATLQHLMDIVLWPLQHFAAMGLQWSSTPARKPEPRVRGPRRS